MRDSSQANKRLHIQPQATIAALNEHELLVNATFADGRRELRPLLLPLEAEQPAELLAFLWQAQVDRVWVMPATRWSRNLNATWFRGAESQWTVIVRGDSKEPERPLSVLLWPKGSQGLAARQLLFVFPEQAGWDWQLADATSLLATVTYLERLLERQIDDGPALLTEQLLRDLAMKLSSNARTPSSSAVSLSYERSAAMSLPETGQKRDLNWMRPLTRVEQRQKYLHHYTHISYHLEACLELPLPEGAYEHSPNGRAYDGRRPGLWRVRAERAGSVFDGKQLPDCLDTEWMTTPQVGCCRDIGYQVQIEEGYYWSQGRPALQPWAGALWQAAERMRSFSPLFKHEQGRANAATSIKRLAALGLSELVDEGKEERHFPLEWRPHLLGGSRAALFAHLVRFVRRGVMPFLLRGDGLWVASDDPDPLTAAPGLFDARRWSGYRVGYTVPLPLTDRVREILRAATSPEEAAVKLDGLTTDSSF